MKIVLLILISLILNAYTIAPANYSGRVKFIKQEILDYYFDGFSFSEISDLVYNKATNRLYMVSDEGALFTFKAKFTPNSYKLEPLKAYRLKSKNGRVLRGKKSDSEGLALDRNGNLYISFEGKPKIWKFSKDGYRLKKIKLPKALKRAKLRSKNKSLEALAWHPKYGLITALEYSKRGDSKLNQTIFSTSGKKWRIKMEPVDNNAITEIEVMDDDNLLVLERAYNGIFGKFQINLVKLYINGCKNKTFCKKEPILKIDSSKGWHVENFEGLAKVGKNRYLMISDDNNYPFTSTVLIYFKIE